MFGPLCEVSELEFIRELNLVMKSLALSGLKDTE
jgi:hypothetical protein